MLKSIIDRQLLLLPGHRLNGPELQELEAIDARPSSTRFHGGRGALSASRASTTPWWTASATTRGRNSARTMPARLRRRCGYWTGSGGRFLGVPGGTTGQRPAGAAGRFRRNTTTGVLEYHDGSGWVSLLEANAVTCGGAEREWWM